MQNLCLNLQYNNEHGDLKLEMLLHKRTLQHRGHQHGARGHQVVCKDHAGRPRASFENSIKMMRIIT